VLGIKIDKLAIASENASMVIKGLLGLFEVNALFSK